MRFSNRWLALILLVILLPVVVYLGAGTYIYYLITQIPGHCNDTVIRDNTPDSFVTRQGYILDPEPYYITDVDYESVTFTHRGGDVQLSGWHIPAANAPANGETVIIVHGLTSCKRDAANLIAASMLHSADFNVLLIDLNDHGESAVVDGRFSAGVREHLDVLGAYDWLLMEKQVAPENIGIMGFSLGAGTASIAFAEEPGIAALWSDSSFSDLETTIAYELRDEYGLPTFLAGSGIMMGRWVFGIDVARYSPVFAFGERRAGRPVYVLHSASDDRLSVDFAYELAAAVQQDDPTFQPWIMDGMGHTETILLDPDAYAERLIGFFDAALREPL